MSTYSILVNSTDKYSDCWIPLFTLIERYWNPRDTTFYLNCESEDFSFKDIDIRPIRNVQGWTWSKCLLNALENIDDDIILYLQDDYFLNSAVRTDEISSFVDLMRNNQEIKHIGLTTYGSAESDFYYEKNNKLKIIKQNAKYRISLQSGLWNKNCLMSYVKDDENAWMLEVFGSARARRRKDLFLTVSKELYLQHPIIRYIHTGIIKGKWHKDIPAFFESEGISADFTRRGIIDPFKSPLRNKFQTYKKILAMPSRLIDFIR